MAEPRGWLATIRGPKHGAPSSWHIVFRREGKLEETAHSWLSTPAGPHPKGLPARRAPNYFVGRGRKKRKKKKKAGKPCEICSISVLIPSYTAGLVLEVTIKSYRGKKRTRSSYPLGSHPTLVCHPFSKRLLQLWDLPPGCNQEDALQCPT